MPSRPGGHNSDTIPRFQVFSSDGSVNLLTEDGCQAYLNRIAAHRAYCDSIRKKVTRSHRLRAKDQGIYHGTDATATTCGSTTRLRGSWRKVTRGRQEQSGVRPDDHRNEIAHRTSYYET